MTPEFDLTRHTKEWEAFKIECVGAWEDLSENCRVKFSNIHGAIKPGEKIDA